MWCYWNLTGDGSSAGARINPGYRQVIRPNNSEFKTCRTLCYRGSRSRHAFWQIHGFLSKTRSLFLSYSSTKQCTSMKRSAIIDLLWSPNLCSSERRPTNESPLLQVIPLRRSSISSMISRVFLCMSWYFLANFQYGCNERSGSWVWLMVSKKVDPPFFFFPSADAALQQLY